MIPPATEKSGLATASLVCGILALPTCFATAIPAVITGHMALSQIDKSGGRYGNRSSAKTGLILGYVTLGVGFLVVMISALAGLTAPLIIRQRHKADQVECISKMRQIGLALMEYQAEKGTDAAPFPTDLKELDTLGITTNIDELLKVSRGDSGEWLYFPTADPKDPAATLLISPGMGGKAVVLTTDLSVKSLPEARALELENAAGGPVLRVPVTER